MNTRRPSSFAVLASLVVLPIVLAASAFAQSAAPGASRPDDAHAFALYPASKVIGLDVRNDSEKNLGDIGDLLIETHSGEVRYAALDVGGFLGVGEDHRVVPWSLIRVVPVMLASRSVFDECQHWCEIGNHLFTSACSSTG